MTDTKLLDGNVDDVKNGLAGLDSAALAALLAVEQAGQNRKTVIDAIDKAITVSTPPTYTADTDRGTGVTTATSDVGKIAAAALTTAADLDQSGPTAVAPATDFVPSGAPNQVTEIDVDHPAVDNHPRIRTTEVMNKIDFNDPTIEGREAVEQNLKAQA